MAQLINNKDSCSSLIPSLSGKGFKVEQTEAGRPNQGGWLLSLADLVTLLLSVIIVTAELTKDDKLAQSANINSLAVGTTFAKSAMTERIERVAFYQNDFDFETSQLTLSGNNSLKLLDNFKQMKPNQVHLKGCIGDGSETSLHHSLSNLLTLSSHAFDGVGAAEQSIVLMAYDCLEGVKHKQDTPTAVIEFSWINSNG